MLLKEIIISTEFFMGFVLGSILMAALFMYYGTTEENSKDE